MTSSAVSGFRVLQTADGADRSKKGVKKPNPARLSSVTPSADPMFKPSMTY